MGSPTDTTADGHPIKVGGKYWSNDLEVVTIKQLGEPEPERRYGEPTGGTVYWHLTERGQIFDGSRLAVRHPFTREVAE